MSGRRGLTVIEVLVSIVILSIVLVAFASIIVGNIRQNALSGNRTAAAQLLNYLGRRAVEGQTAVLPLSPDTSKSWDYGKLQDSFSDITKDANPSLYRAEVVNQGQPAWVTDNGLSLTSYVTRVCWQSPGGESCVEAQTIAPIVSGAGAPPPLTGLN